jgi:hypothetical protein
MAANLLILVRLFLRLSRYHHWSASTYVQTLWIYWNIYAPCMISFKISSLSRTHISSVSPRQSKNCTPSDYTWLRASQKRMKKYLPIAQTWLPVCSLVLWINFNHPFFNWKSLQVSNIVVQALASRLRWQALKLALHVHPMPQSLSCRTIIELPSGVMYSIWK